MSKVDFVPTLVGEKILILRTRIGHSPKWSPDSSTSEVTTVQLEFRDLSRVTGDSRYEDAAAEVSRKVHEMPKKQGLVQIYINANTGKLKQFACLPTYLPMFVPTSREHAYRVVLEFCLNVKFLPIRQASPAIDHHTWSSRRQLLRVPVEAVAADGEDGRLPQGGLPLGDGGGEAMTFHRDMLDFVADVCMTPGPIPLGAAHSPEPLALHRRDSLGGQGLQA